MPKLTVFFAALLIGLGSIGYFGTSTAPAIDDPAIDDTVTDSEPSASSTDDSAPTSADTAPGKRSVTALIPAFIGAALLLCGLLAMNEGLRMHAMHGAVLVGLLGMLAGAGRGFMGLGKFLSGDPSLNQRGFIFVWLMTIICAVYVVLCVRSFLEARKQRKLAEAPE